MIFKKQDVLDTLEKYNFDRNNYIIISGAALVLYGVKNSTNDIDIAVCNELYNKLLKQYNCKLERRIGNYDIWFINDVINFSNHYYYDIEYTDYLGYKVQTLESILKLKRSLNRPKDKNDIESILAFGGNCESYKY